MLLDILTPDDLIALDDYADAEKEERAEFRRLLEERDWEDHIADLAAAAERAEMGSEDDDEPVAETRIFRPWHQNKAIGPWGPKHPKAKRVTLRSHRTGR